MSKPYYLEAPLQAKLEEMQAKGINDVSGLYTGEPEFIRKMARLAPNGAGLEIGVRFAHSLICWGRVRQGRGAIIGVELEDRPLMRSNLAASGLDAAIIIGDSGEAAIPVEELAFLFIDGDHRRAAVKLDIERYVSLLIPGGIVVFHDYLCNKKKYVEFAVTEVVKKWHRKTRWTKLGHKRHMVAFRRPIE